MEQAIPQETQIPMGFQPGPIVNRPEVTHVRNATEPKLDNFANLILSPSSNLSENEVFEPKHKEYKLGSNNHANENITARKPVVVFHAN